jgi:hypothetical protein
MKPLAVAAVALAVLAAAAGAAYVVVGGGDEGLRPPKPAPEPPPALQGGTDAPGGVANGAANGPGNAGATEKPVLRMEDVPAPRAPKFPDPGEEPALAAELVPGDGQTFSVPWLADHVATGDWRAAGVHLRRSILRTRDYVRAVRAYAKDVEEIYGSVRESQHGAIAATGRLFPVLAPFETPASPAGIFSSPVAYANALAATLAAMNRPLSRAQIDALQPLFDEAVATERQLRAELPPSGYLYDRDLARCELRAKLRTAVEAILDEDQRMLASPPELRDRVGLDVFSPYALWDERCEERTADDTMESVSDAFLQTLSRPRIRRATRSSPPGPSS